MVCVNFSMTKVYLQNNFMRRSINLSQLPIFESKTQIILVENNPSLKVYLESKNCVNLVKFIFSFCLQI